MDRTDEDRVATVDVEVVARAVAQIPVHALAGQLALYKRFASECRANGRPDAAANHDAWARAAEERLSLERPS